MEVLTHVVQREGIFGSTVFDLSKLYEIGIALLLEVRVLVLIYQHLRGSRLPKVSFVGFTFVPDQI